MYVVENYSKIINFLLLFYFLLSVHVLQYNVMYIHLLNRPEEILYVDVLATAIKPSLFLVTNDGSATIDFGDVGVGKNN